jgi:hypothetical protein
MLTINLIPGIRQVANRHADLFDTKFSSQDFCALLMLHFLGLKSLSDLARSMPGSPSVSAMSEAVHHFPVNRFQRRFQARMLRKFKSKLEAGDAILAIDETHNIKYGRTILGQGRWHKHAKGCYQGQKIVVLAIIDRTTGEAFPISFRVCEKNSEGCQDISTFDLSLSMLDEIEAVGYPKCPVVMDSWFDSAPFMDELSQRGWTFVIELKSNRFVRSNPNPKSKWKKITSSYQGLPRVGVKHVAPRSQKKMKTKYVVSQRLYIKKRKSPLHVSTVFNKISGKPFAYYATNQLEMAGAEIWRLSRSRWHLEEAFKNLKTYFSFGKLSCQGHAGIETSLYFSFLALAELQDEDLCFSGLTKLPSDSVGTRIEKIRQLSFNASLHLMLYNPNHKLVNQLKTRRSLDRIHKKPVNTVAGAIRSQIMLEKSA